MATLYIHEQGASVRRVHQRLKVVKGNEVLHTVRLRDLDRLVLLGNVDLTAQAMAVLLEEGIDTVILSSTGRLRGHLQPAESKNVLLRQAQFQRYADITFRMRIAKGIVDGKIRNARAMVHRHAHNHPDPLFAETMAALEISCEKVTQQETPEQLLGIEGDAARRYFAAFGKMLRGELIFNGRSRRPPRDAVNAVLSFGYTLVMTELVGVAAAEGMDAHVGLLHDLNYGRPSLALDVLEEFRQPVVDRLVLALVNRKVLQPAHFDGNAERGVLLNDEGRARFLRYYHKTMDEPFNCRDWADATPATFRLLLRRQMHRMRTAIEFEQDYAPYLHYGRTA